MKVSIYQQKNIDALKKRAKALYKTGLPLRKVALLVGKSHEWVRRAVNNSQKEVGK